MGGCCARSESFEVTSLPSPLAVYSIASTDIDPFWEKNAYEPGLGVVLIELFGQEATLCELSTAKSVSLPKDSMAFPSSSSI